MGGGGGLLEGLSQLGSGLGGANAEASGIGGGIFSPQGMGGMGPPPGPTPDPVTGMGDFGSGPAGASPPPTSTAQLLNGGPSPQMNALQLAFGQTTVDPLTGGVVPAGSTTGNNVPAGPTPQGIISATKQLATPSTPPPALPSPAKPTQLAYNQGGTMSDAPPPWAGGDEEDLPARPPGQQDSTRPPLKQFEEMFKREPSPQEQQEFLKLFPQLDPSKGGDLPTAPPLQVIQPGQGQEKRYPSEADRLGVTPREPAPANGPPIGPGLQAPGGGITPEVSKDWIPQALAANSGTPDIVKQAFNTGVAVGSGKAPAPGPAGTQTAWDWQSFRDIPFYEDRTPPGADQSIRDRPRDKADKMTPYDWAREKQFRPDVPEKDQPLNWKTPLEIEEEARVDKRLREARSQETLKRQYGDPRERSSYYRAEIADVMRKPTEGESLAYMGLIPEYPDRMAQRDPNPGGYSYLTEYDSTYRPTGAGKRRADDGGMLRASSDVREPGNMGLDVPELPAPDPELVKLMNKGKISPQTVREQMAGAEALAAPVPGAATGARGVKPSVVEQAFEPIRRDSVAMPPRMRGGAGDYRDALPEVPSGGGPGDYQSVADAARAKENARVDLQTEVNAATPTWWRRFTGTGAYEAGQPLAEAERISPTPLAPSETLREATRRQFELSPEGRGRYGQGATQGPPIPAGLASLPPPPELPGPLNLPSGTTVQPPSPYGTASAMRPEQLTEAFNPDAPPPLTYAQRQEAAKSGEILPPTSIAGMGAQALTELGDKYPLRGRESLTPEQSYGQFGLGGIFGPPPQGPPIPTAGAAASGGTPGSAERVVYGLPGEQPGASAPSAQKPTTTVTIDKDGNVSYGTGPNPFLQPPKAPPPAAPLPPAATPAAQPAPPTGAAPPEREPEPVPAPVVRIPPRAGNYPASIYPQGPVQPIRGWTPEENAELTGTNPDMQRVVRRAAEDNPGLFRLQPQTRTMRSQAEQDEMVKRGWSGTRSSYHQAGNAVDIVPVNPKTMQPDSNYLSGYPEIERAMKDAAKKEGVPNVAWGGRWGNPDRPHWEITGGPRGPQGPDDYIKPDVPVIKGDTGPANWRAFAAQQESGGTADPYAARTSLSSAKGKYQFIDKTWNATVDASVPEASTMTPEQKLALRQDPEWQEAMMLAHTKLNVGLLEQAGLPATNANLLAMHQMGPKAIQVIQNPNDPIAKYLSPEAVANNPSFRTTGANYLSASQTKADAVFPSEVAAHPQIAGTPQREVLASAAQRGQAVAQATPPAGTVATPQGQVTTPGGRIIPQQRPIQVPEPPQKLPDPKVDTTKYRKAVEELTPAQVVRMSKEERTWRVLAGVFGGMTHGKTWGETMMGGATGGFTARAGISADDRQAQNTENERDFQYRQRKAALEGELMKVDQQNAQGDVNAANVNAERAYEAQKFNTTQQQQAANTNEAATAAALNAEREEGKPKVSVTEKGITTQQFDPVSGQTVVKHTPLPEVADDFKRQEEIGKLLKQDNFAAQDSAYKYIGEKYGSAGIKLQILGDLAQNSRYAQVFGGNKQLIDRLKKVASDANKLLPLASQTDPKQTAAAQEDAVKAELVRLWQNGTLGEEWIRDLQAAGHPGALRLQPQARPQAAPPSRAGEPSGLGQGAAFQ